MERDIPQFLQFTQFPHLGNILNPIAVKIDYTQIAKFQYYIVYARNVIKREVYPAKLLWTLDN